MYANYVFTDFFFINYSTLIPNSHQTGIRIYPGAILRVSFAGNPRSCELGTVAQLVSVCKK